MKRIFTTNWYLQKIYFPSVVMNEEAKEEKNN